MRRQSQSSKLEAELEALKAKINCLLGNHAADAYTKTEAAHTYTCTACGTEVTEEHEYAEGACVCGAEEPTVTAEAEWGASANALTASGTFAEAVTAANAENSTVGYIRLLKDVVLEKVILDPFLDIEDPYEFKPTMPLTLDLNGKAIDGLTNGAYASLGGGSLTIDDTVGTGKVLSGESISGAFCVSSWGSSSPATLTVKGGSFIGRSAIFAHMGKVTLILEGGFLNGTMYADIEIVNEEKTVYVKGSTFSSRVASFSYLRGYLDLTDATGDSYSIVVDATAGMPVGNITLPEDWSLYYEDGTEVTEEVVAKDETVIARPAH